MFSGTAFNYDRGRALRYLKTDGKHIYELILLGVEAGIPYSLRATVSAIKRFAELDEVTWAVRWQAEEHHWAMVQLRQAQTQQAYRQI